VHHAFRLTDKASGRVLDKAIEIHTLELARYNQRELDLPKASQLERWLFWLLHAHEYESDALLKLFPESAMQLATQTITRISEITEDKTMYDAREKAIRDHQWALSAAHNEGKLEGKLEGILEGETKGKLEGKLEGEIKLIRTLEAILEMPLSDEAKLQKQSLEQLQKLAATLQDMARNRA
jgi:hypothetical protein